MTTVVVFSRSAVVRAGLESIVDSTPGFRAVGGAANREDLAQMIADRQPDMVLADLPEAIGDAIRFDLREVAAVVVLSTQDDVESLRDTLTLGARALLDRQASSQEISGALEAAAAGLVVLQPAHAASLSAAAPTYTRGVSAPVEELTPRESEVLGMLAEGLPNKTIARRLGISDHTVKFHVGSIMAKLQASSRTEAVTIGMRRGLVTI